MGIRSSRQREDVADYFALDAPTAGQGGMLQGFCIAEII
jgi:hypothetical protein